MDYSNKKKTNLFHVTKEAEQMLNANGDVVHLAFVLAVGMRPSDLR